MLCLRVEKLIRNRYCLLALLLLAPGVFSQSVPSMEVELRPARTSSEIRHARKAAVENYPLRATQLDLSVLSDKEQEEIQSLLSDPIKTYVGIGRDVYLTEANWAMVKREDGFSIWQAQIYSPAALSLNVRFSDFDLGLGMSVKVYGLGGGVGAPVGEYTDRGLGDGGKLWSLSVHGDTVVVEYWLPAEFETRPADFPFRVERLSHGFRDEEGRLSGVNVRSFVPRQSTCGSPLPVCAADDENAQGVALYFVTDHDGRRGQCSGVLLNNGNEPRNRTLYFLTAFHCIDGVVRSSEAPKGTRINTEFRFHYDTALCGSDGYISGGNSRFIAGSIRGDWALLRIDGDLTNLSRKQLYYRHQGWSARHLGVFFGYILHHPVRMSLGFSSFLSIGLSHVVGTGTNSYFEPCTHAGCSHFKYSLDRATSGGSSGAPIFYPVGDYVVGVHTHGISSSCVGWGARFSKMYEDGRVKGALTYGDDYYFDRGAAMNFADSDQPGYNLRGQVPVRLKVYLGGAVR